MTMLSSRRLVLPCCSHGPWPVPLDYQLAPSRSRHAKSVVAPYRLDLTVSALRRLSTNVVDVLTPDGEYVRALAGAHSPVIVRDPTATRCARRHDRERRAIRAPRPIGRSRTSRSSPGARRA